MKRLRKMLAMLVVLGLLIGGYYALNSMQETQSVTQTAGTFELGAWTEETLCGLAWSNDNGTFAFTLEDGEWLNTADAVFPVNQSTLENLAKKMTELTGTREIADVTDPADYGLAEPVFSVTVTDEQGNQIVYAQGDETPFGDGYYLSVSGRDVIYTVETALDDAFNKTLTQLCRLETIPSLDTVTRVRIGEAVDAVYDEASGSWTDSITGEPLDADAVAELADSVQNIEWYTVVAASADAQRLAAYGLDDTQATVLHVEGGEDTPLEIRIGSKDADGNAYACLPDSSMVYLIEGEALEEILAAGMDSLWNRQPVALAVESLASAEFVWETGSLAVSADTEGAQNLWEMITALEGTQRVEAAAQGSPVLSISYTDTEGEAHSASVYTYSVDSYLLPITGTHAMLLPADEVDAIIRTAKSL